MNFDEIWGIAFSRVSAFFASQNDVEKTGSNSFKFNNTCIELKALPDKSLGSMRVSQTRVIIRGLEAEEIHHRFYLQFLSAGG